MSRPRPGLSNKVEDVVRWLDGMKYRPWIKRVYLRGSRSPWVNKEPRPDSDWDFFFEHDGTGYLPRPEDYGIHGDANGRSRIAKVPHDAVEIWPIDTCGILKWQQPPELRFVT